jgi:hypothetical protein
MESLLCVSHNIFLTKEQRYSLYEGNNIEVVGVSVPVWFYNKNETNEPAIEVFCKYFLKCENKSFQKNIEISEEGYEIKLYKNNIFNGVSNKIKKYFKIKENNMPTAKSLLDIKDGGSEWLDFKVYDSTEYINIIHSIEIQKIENLFKSLVY